MANIRKLSPKLAEFAAKEINETPERIEKDLTLFKEWISQSPHLNARIDDQWLIVFLRGCKYSLERAKEKFDMFYTFKTLVPEFFKNRDETKDPLKLIIENETNMPIVDQLDETRPFIIYWRPFIGPDVDVTVELTQAVLKYSFMTTEIFLYEEDRYSINGVIAVIDLECLHFNHLLYLTPPMIKKCLKAIEHVYPIRVKQVHYINVPTIWLQVLKVIKMAASKKLASRIFAHKGVDTLYEYVPQRLLPAELGGDQISRVDSDAAMKKKLAEYHDWMMEDEKFGTNEKLRVGKSMSTETIFGIDGSFRKLTVD